MKMGIQHELDLHGRTLAEAEGIFYGILNEIRLQNEAREVMFITGTGKIQELLKSLATQYELNAYIPLANRGCIVVEFE